MRVPKPEILTLRPSRRLSRMIAKTASTTSPASFFGEPKRSWIKSMRSVLVMRINPHLEGCCFDVRVPSRTEKLVENTVASGDGGSGGQPHPMSKVELKRLSTFRTGASKSRRCGSRPAAIGVLGRHSALRAFQHEEVVLDFGYDRHSAVLTDCARNVDFGRGQ